MQAKELEDILNKIFYSTKPAARMKDLSEDLNLAIGGDSTAMKTLTNDKNMRKILRGTKDDFEHFTKVIEICTELTQSKELRALKQEADPSSNAELVTLEQYASTFIQCYIRQHCSVYADLLFEIKETEVAPKKVKKEGEEEEEEDDEIKEKRKRNKESKD